MNKNQHKAIICDEASTTNSVAFPQHSKSKFSLQLKRIKRLTGILILILLVIILYQWLTPILNTTDSFSLNDWTVKLVAKLNWQQEGKFSVLNIAILFAFLTVATTIGLPRQIAAFVAGINLGVMVGVIVATLATTIGCLSTFLLSRYFFSHKVTLKYPTQLAKLSTFLSDRTLLKAIAIRLLPLGSNFITNIVAGVSKVPMRPYVIGSGIGFIPQMVIFSLAGSGIQLADNDQLMMSGILLLAALLISAYLVKVHKRNS